MRLKVCSLIGMADVRDAKTRNTLVDQHAGYRDRLLVLQCVRVNVFSKVIDDCQYVSVSTLRARKRANNVHGHEFKWRSRVDRSNFSAVARFRLLPISSRAFFTPVLDVFTDLQPVKPLFEFVDSLLNSEVASRRKAVCKFDDLLARCPRDHCFKRRFGSSLTSVRRHSTPSVTVGSSNRA